MYNSKEGLFRKENAMNKTMIILFAVSMAVGSLFAIGVTVLVHKTCLTETVPEPVVLETGQKHHPKLDDLERALCGRMEAVVEGFLTEAADTFRSTRLGRDWKAFWRHLRDKGASNAGILPEDLPETAWKDLTAWQTIADVLSTKDGKPRRQVGPARGGFYNGFAKGPWGAQVKDLPLRTIRLLAGLDNRTCLLA